MANYTIDLYSLLKDSNFKLFDFDYEFYTDDPLVKQSFETKFIDRYLFHEVGFETVARFKHYLKQRLNNISVYYKQLYITELESKKCNFMLNKDLKETFERDITGNNLTNTKSNMLNNSIANLSGTDNSNVGFKESAIDNGVASLDLEVGSVTTVNQSNNTNTSTNQSTSNDTTDLDSNTSNNKNEKETTTLISQGNIGVTSSGSLLTDWREVLINIDNLIIEECNDLFMQIY